MSEWDEPPEQAKGCMEQGEKQDNKLYFYSSHAEKILLGRFKTEWMFKFMSKNEAISIR